MQEKEKFINNVGALLSKSKLIEIAKKCKLGLQKLILGLSFEEKLDQEIAKYQKDIISFIKEWEKSNSLSLKEIQFNMIVNKIKGIDSISTYVVLRYLVNNKAYLKVFGFEKIMKELENIVKEVKHSIDIDAKYYKTNLYNLDLKELYNQLYLDIWQEFDSLFYKEYLNNNLTSENK